jgi:tetratricopeptide (TPR) repeat protein
MLNERRRLLHERIGAALESIYAESLDDHVAELAHHYSRSGNPDKAVKYCLGAVQQYAGRGSDAEAVTQFETGIEQLQKLPDDNRRAELELDLRIAAGFALGSIKGYASPEVEQSSERVTELRQRLTINFEKTWSALYGVYSVHVHRPDVRKACETATEMVARAEEHGNVLRVASAIDLLAYARHLSGEFELAAQGFDRAWALLESIAKPATGLTEPRVAGPMSQAETLERLLALEINRTYSAVNLWVLGYPDRSLERLSIGASIARESGFKIVLEDLHFHGYIICELRRELEPMRERAEATLELATELGNPMVRAQCEIRLGWVDAMAGHLDAGIARMRRHLLEHRAGGSEFLNDYHLALIATALGRARRFDEGLRSFNESFSIIERSGQRWYEAEAHRLKGELLLAQDASNAAQADQSFRTAIENFAQAAREVVGIARDDEPRTLARAARSSRHTARDAGRHLQLVHRGLRHRRPDRRQGAAE